MDTIAQHAVVARALMSHLASGEIIIRAFRRFARELRNNDIIFDTVLEASRDYTLTGINRSEQDPRDRNHASPIGNIYSELLNRRLTNATSAIFPLQIYFLVKFVAKRFSMKRLKSYSSSLIMTRVPTTNMAVCGGFL